MPPRKIEISPRKNPRQARAVATVDAIVGAASQVLVSHGYEVATTARIAERAGVSIGTLYQYFPNKEAVVAALIDRHADELVDAVERELAMHETIDTGLRAVMEVAMAARRIDPRLHRILLEQLPHVGRAEKARVASRRISLLLEQFLRAHGEIGDAAVVAQVIETMLESLGHEAIVEQRPELVDEALTAVGAYVAAGRLAQ